MGSSLILTGGVATAKTLREVITQPAHGFAVGDVLRWDAGSAKYRLAMADSAENAEVVGVVDTIDDASNFKLVYSGYLDVSTLAGITVPVLFLSGASAGKLVTTPPSSIGSVIKPVLTKANNTNGYVLTNYLGTQIGGSSTIAIDEIQPVGTIMPFAGSAIPDTWLECNGATYSMSSYPELYSKLCYTTGDRAPIYGHVFTVTTSTVYYATGKSATDIANGIAAGVYLRYGAGGVGQVPYLIAKVLSITGSGNAITLTAQVVPIYDTTSKTFVVPNLILPTGNTINGIGNLNAGWGEDYVTEAVASTVSVTSFCVPNLRGRTIIGTNSSAYSLDETDDPEVIRSSIGLYPQGAHGGEEKHTLTEGELPSHSHGLKAIAIQLASGTPTYNLISADNHGGNLSGTVGSYTGSDGLPPRTGATGSNVSHNNMPPYLAVRYIIKAKPYTRAAVIDGVDLPYSNLLVRSTDSNSLRSELLSGVSGGDLVFYTNSGEASKTGTERMRLTAGGTLSHGGINNPLYKNYSVSIFGTGVTYASNPSYPDQLPTNLSGLNGIILSGGKSNTSSTGLVYESAGGGGAGLVFSRDYGYGTYISLVTNSEPSSANTGRIIERMRINSSGNIGIGTTGPNATLDVNGTLKVGNFGGDTNVMVKPTNAAGTVGQVVPLFTWGGNIGTASDERNHTAPIPSGTWLVVLSGISETNGQGASYVAGTENKTLSMAQTWVVPSGKYLVFAHSDQSSVAASATTSGLAWKLINASDVASYRTLGNPFTPNTITSTNGWNNICKSNGTAQLINEQNADTATGGDKQASGCVYQGGGGWGVTVQVTGYAIRIA